LTQSLAPIREMFDALVPEYDRFNRLSSLGLDVSWRREVARMFPVEAQVLDVGTGTGDLAKNLIERGCRVVGVDFSERMVLAARKKLGEAPNARFEVARADELPFEPRSFEGITSAFVIRNLHHGEVMSQSLREFYRVLKPGGQMVHLELTRPPQKLLSMGHRAYLRWILPLIGRVNFGERWPKDYLERTIEKFPDPRNVGQQMRWAGFEKIGFYPLSGGIAGLFVGHRC
jgi:demethylmenaquinone methyltransferase / 2-methoxy-6-polyprenyl-1,4-benzoquinol methylase